MISIPIWLLVVLIVGIILGAGAVIWFLNWISHFMDGF
jgi:hypothetical protein